MKRFAVSVRSVSVALILVVGLLSHREASAQLLSSGDLFGPGAPPPMLGIEIGLGEHQQLGTFDCDCGSSFGQGSGTGFLGSILFELPIDYEWAVGFKGSIDFKNISSTIGTNDTVVFNDPLDQKVTIPVFPMDRNAYVQTTYVDLTPYVQYQFFRMGPFVQAGVDVGLLIANHFTQQRQLTNTSAKIGDTIYNNIRFSSNGTTEETIQDSSINNVNKLRLGLVLSAGYNIPISDRSILSPMLTYDFPFTTIRDVAANGWKIGSLYASVVLKFRLD
jgi:hypothetical protein